MASLHHLGIEESAPSNLGLFDNLSRQTKARRQHRISFNFHNHLVDDVINRLTTVDEREENAHEGR